MRYAVLLFICAMIPSCTGSRFDGDAILGVWLSEIADSEMGELKYKVTIDESDFKLEFLFGDEGDGSEGTMVLEGAYSYERGDLVLLSSFIYGLDEQGQRVDEDDEEHGTLLGDRYSIKRISDDKMIFTERDCGESTTLTRISSNPVNQ
ncbi:MAG: hypothetical protein WD342_16685 [Verrucomicrobiales bacterium]